MKERIILYGLGRNFRNVYYLVNVDSVNLLGLSDIENKSIEWLGQYNYIKPEDIYKYDVDSVIISSIKYENDIRKMLVSYGVNTNIIFGFENWMSNRNRIVNNLERREFFNFFRDYADVRFNKRILLIGDSLSGNYREQLSKKTECAVDCFLTSSIKKETIQKGLDFFFSFEEYKYDIAQIEIGYHGILHEFGARETCPITEFQEMYEWLICYALYRVPRLIIATTTEVVHTEELDKKNEKVNRIIEERNRVAIRLAQKYNLLVNDLYNYMANEMKEIRHRDCVHFSEEGSPIIAERTAKIMEEIMI